MPLPCKGDFATCREVKDGLRSNKWYHCREFFGKAFADNWRERNGKTILFSNYIKADTIALFMKRLELKVDPKTKIGPTQTGRVVWIEVSPWWLNDAMRRSFFTLALRAAVHTKYTKHNNSLLNILKNTSHTDTCQYIKETEYAVKRFLKGYTKYVGGSGGWYNTFRATGRYYNHLLGYSSNVVFDQKHKARINKLLVKP